MGDNDGMMAGPVAELLNSQQFAGQMNIEGRDDANGPPTMGPEGLTGVPGQSVGEPSIGPFTPSY